MAEEGVLSTGIIEFLYQEAIQKSTIEQTDPPHEVFLYRHEMGRQLLPVLLWRTDKLEQKAHTLDATRALRGGVQELQAGRVREDTQTLLKLVRTAVPTHHHEKVLAEYPIALL